MCYSGLETWFIYTAFVCAWGPQKTHLNRNFSHHFEKKESDIMWDLMWDLLTRNVMNVAPLACK